MGVTMQPYTMPTIEIGALSKLDSSFGGDVSGKRFIKIAPMGEVAKTKKNERTIIYGRVRLVMLPQLIVAHFLSINSQITMTWPKSNATKRVKANTGLSEGTPKIVFPSMAPKPHITKKPMSIAAYTKR